MIIKVYALRSGQTVEYFIYHGNPASVLTTMNLFSVNQEQEFDERKIK
jgi:hypothetical protein